MPNKNPESSIQYPGSSWDVVERAAQGAERTPAFLLILGIQLALPSDRKLAAFAQALRLDIFTARQWLLSPTPRVIRRDASHERILEWVEWLKAVGVRAFDLPEQLIAEQRFTTPEVITTVGDELLLKSEGADDLTAQLDDIVCGVWGEVRERIETQATSPTLAGEVIAARDVATRSEIILDLHLRSASTAIRIAQDRVRWSAMFPGESGNSSSNIKRLRQQMEKQLPRIAIHDDFGRAGSVLGTSRELLGRSTYLQANWLGAGGRLRLRNETRNVESTVMAFDIYSTLLRWETLRIGPPR